MPSNLKYFDSETVDPNAEGVTVMIPYPIDEKRVLMKLIADGLRFPSYFGFNWDALEECLADLSWLNVGKVTLWHEGLPLANDPEQARRYLEILQTAVGEHQTLLLDVWFPVRLREDIKALLR